MLLQTNSFSLCVFNYSSSWPLLQQWFIQRHALLLGSYGLAAPKQVQKKVLKMGKKCFPMITTGALLHFGPETKLLSPQKSPSGNGLDWFICLVANSSEVRVGKANTEMSPLLFKWLNMLNGKLYQHIK